jgi:hypothetical protein
LTAKEFVIDLRNATQTAIKNVAVVQLLKNFEV